MNPEQENQDIEILDEDAEIEEGSTVDDFIRQLEAREKDLHITSDTTIIEIAASFEDGDIPEFLKKDLEKAATSLPDVKKDNSLADRTIKLEGEIAKHKAKIARLEDERSEIFANSQRRAKDFENFKVRAAKERTETFQSQLSNLAKFLLPALDNFNRAIASAEKLSEVKSTEFQQFFEGVVLVNHQIYDIFEKMGIEKIPTVGEMFDPHFHEAVATEERVDLPNNHISEELVQGFRIGDRVIRHSMVKVVLNPSNGSNERVSTDEVFDPNV